MHKVGIIGLGKMGLALAHRLLKASISVIGFDVDATARQRFDELGARSVSSIQEIAQMPIIWIMVPAPVVDDVLKLLSPVLQAQQIIVDGGNSHFSDSVVRAQELKKRNIFFLDCGTSGGLAGKEHGFCLTIGGDKQAFTKTEPIFAAIAAPGAYAYVGPSGAGHYVKMVHNGIEYALLQSYAQGLQLLKEGEYKQLDLVHITAVWNKAAIIRSYILELTHTILAHDQKLDAISGAVEETGMGAWTVQEAHKQQVPVTLIEQAVKIRAWSRKTGGNYATKLVALLRNAFGGHGVGKK